MRLITPPHTHIHTPHTLPNIHPAHLYHESLDVAVEDDVVVVAAGGERQKILRGAGGLLAVQLQLDVTQGGVERERLQGRRRL